MFYNFYKKVFIFIDGQECFDQQYTNHVVDLRTLHVIQKIAVIAPLGAFHVALPTVGSTADDHGDGIGYFDDKYRTLIFLRKENGELLVCWDCGN